MIKDIAVHLDGGRADAARLALAERVANLFDGHLTGLFVHRLPMISVPFDAGGMAAQLMADMEATARAEGDVRETRLRADLAQLGLRHDFRRMDLVGEASNEAVVREARTADIMVMARPYATGAEPVSPELTEQVMFGSGRAVMLAPRDAARSGDFATVVAAWDGGREGTRAIAEAMPFLRRATRVVLVTVDRETLEDSARLPAADMARHLDRHGIAVKVNQIRSRQRNPSDAILEQLALAEADLLVMGGYGHSRLRQWVLGGVTRDVMTHASIPVLLAH